MSNLHRKTKQEDSEALASALQACCAFDNSALVEDDICIGSNEYYFRVAEHYVEVDGGEEVTPADLEKVADVLTALALQFRVFAENMKEEQQ